MFLNKEEVLSFMPHRDPFLFVDTVSSIDIPGDISGDNVHPRALVDSIVTANFHVRENLDILKGHFPGNPILPGVIQVEMMAQTCAFASLGLNNLKIEGIKVETLLLGANSTKFRKPVLPGMDLEIKAKMIKCRGEVAQYECSITSNGEKISESNLLAKLTVIK